MKYLKVWLDFESVLSPLEDDEIGRLFLAMLHYAGTGEEPESFKGNESFLWPVAKRDIDVMAEKTETLRANGLKGGRPITKQNQTKPNESKTNQTKANKSLQDMTRHKQDMTGHNSFIADDEAHGIQTEQNRVLDAAQDAGFLNSNSVRSKLLKLYAEFGLEKMLNAFDSCVKHSAPNLAYLEACLKAAPKKAKVNAQAYEQRDYADVQDQIMKAQEKRILDRLGAG